MGKYLLGLLFSIVIVQTSTAGGIKGKVLDENGEPLGFVTIFVEELQTGTTTNTDGLYEFKLEPGSYHVVFQYIGYEKQIKQVTVDQTFVTLNIQMSPQVMMLKDIEVYAGKEDPAYTIMRKAIAKSKFHTQQLDRYTATVYMKGKGELTDAPFFARRALEKEGVKEGRVFISESVSEIEYIRPNTYNERVISIYSTGDDGNSSPNAYINGSFYEPTLAKSISPLSPRAFSYYKFEYDGTFQDGEYAISKIKVKPRSRGDNVFEGYIQIVEDYWSIHSLELSTTKLGIDFNIKQIYKPVQDKAWLPVTHEFTVEGKVFGFGFVGNYLASVSNYEIELNPELKVELEVIDEKLEKDLAEELEDQFEDKEDLSEINEVLNTGQEVTRKQLKKIMKAYEKAEMKEQEEPDVISITSYKIDSLANNRDSSFWADIRPVPLTTKEVEGYQITDSIAQVEKAKSEGDTLNIKRSRKGFKLQHVLLGGSYKVGEKAYFEIDFPNIQYNTVEGVNVDYSISFRKTLKNKNWIKFGPTARYSFEREKLTGFFSGKYGFGPTDSRNDLQFKVGRYVSQFNQEEPIHPLVNSLMTLFLERNFMKIYEKDFFDLTYSKRLSDQIDLKVSAEYAHRRQLFNNTDYRFYDRSGEGFTPNSPFNLDLIDTSFPNHQSLRLAAKVRFRPWVKYRIRNGKKRPVYDDSPQIEASVASGVPDVAESDTEYTNVELGVKHNFNIGVRGLVDFKLKAGIFLDNSQTFFMDYKHFPGNRTPITTDDPVGSYRLLDYYAFSTNEQYFQAHLHYQFRKFLLTRIPILRLTGVRESFFTNYLANDLTSSYTELGYGINYIFRVFRVEAVTSFEGGEYRDWGIRVGIATNLDDIF